MIDVVCGKDFTELIGSDFGITLSAAIMIYITSVFSLFATPRLNPYNNKIPDREELDLRGASNQYEVPNLGETFVHSLKLDAKKYD